MPPLRSAVRERVAGERVREVLDGFSSTTGFSVDISLMMANEQLSPFPLARSRAFLMSASDASRGVFIMISEIGRAHV